MRPGMVRASERGGLNVLPTLLENASSLAI